MQAAGINPYRYIPADPHLVFLRDDAIYPYINRREYAPTIYPPGAQMFFFAVTRVTGTIAGFKAALFCLEMLTLGLLARLLAAFNLPRERATIYAWNPLIVWEFCSGHIDVLMTALVLLALLARQKERDKLTGFLLALATLVKFSPLVLFPALWRRRDWKMPLIFAATIGLGYLPYLGVGTRVIGFLPAYTGEEGMGDGPFFFLLLARYLSGGLPIPALAYLLIGGAVLSWLAYAHTCVGMNRDLDTFSVPERLARRFSSFFRRSFLGAGCGSRRSWPSCRFAICCRSSFSSAARCSNTASGSMVANGSGSIPSSRAIFSSSCQRP